MILHVLQASTLLLYFDATAFSISLPQPKGKSAQADVEKDGSHNIYMLHLRRTSFVKGWWALRAQGIYSDYKGLRRGHVERLTYVKWVLSKPQSLLLCRSDLVANSPSCW